MTVDPVVALESLGYTEREASFLYLVAVHSGYFLRRQFDYFINRNKGSIVMRFLEKARVAGHIQLLDTTHRRQVYHLFYKPIYRLVGAPNSQNRRVKGDADVRARLMKLDYVLENDLEHYLENNEEKLEYFAKLRGIDSQIFTTDDALRAEIQSTLISVVDRTQPATSLVRFICVDEGMLTITKFQRVLTAMSALLRAVAYFELIYVATSHHNFREAATLFRKEFAVGSERWQQVLDPDWQNISLNRPVPPVHLRPQFTTLLLRFSYPSLQRNELHGSRQGSELAR